MNMPRNYVPRQLPRYLSGLASSPTIPAEWMQAPNNCGVETREQAECIGQHVEHAAAQVFSQQRFVPAGSVYGALAIGFLLGWAIAKDGR